MVGDVTGDDDEGQHEKNRRDLRKMFDNGDAPLRNVDSGDAPLKNSQILAPVTYEWPMERCSTAN